jgi:hypothetical protein
VASSQVVINEYQKKIELVNKDIKEALEAIE